MLNPNPELDQDTQQLLQSSVGIVLVPELEHMVQGTLDVYNILLFRKTLADNFPCSDIDGAKEDHAKFVVLVELNHN